MHALTFAGHALLSSPGKSRQAASRVNKHRVQQGSRQSPNTGQKPSECGHAWLHHMACAHKEGGRAAQHYTPYTQQARVRPHPHAHAVSLAAQGRRGASFGLELEGFVTTRMHMPVLGATKIARRMSGGCCQRSVRCRNQAPGQWSRLRHTCRRAHAPTYRSVRHANSTRACVYCMARCVRATIARRRAAAGHIQPIELSASVPSSLCAGGMSLWPKCKRAHIHARTHARALSHTHAEAH
jgi:hypothetical protein